MSRVESLRFLCRGLSPYVAGEALRPALRAVCWDDVIALANNYFVVPALWIALERKGLTAELDPTVAGYLEAVYHLNAERNEAIRGQLDEAVAALNRAGVEPLLLKGGAALAADLFAAPGVRFMLDLDLWVAAGTTDTARAALAAIGYAPRADAVQSEDHKHEAPLWKDERWVRVELHRRILSDTANDAAFAARLESVAVRLPSGVARVLSPTLQVLHSLLHSEVCHRGYAHRYIDLRQLHNFVTLCHVHGAAVDWRIIEAVLAEAGLSPVLRAYRHLAARLFALPVAAKPALAERLWLQTALLPFRGRAAHALMAQLLLLQLVRESFGAANIRHKYPTRNGLELQLNRLRHFGALLRKYLGRGRLREQVARVSRGWSHS